MKGNAYDRISPLVRFDRHWCILNVGVRFHRLHSEKGTEIIDLWCIVLVLRRDYADGMHWLLVGSNNPVTYVTYRTYTHRSSFYWNSKLLDDRKDKIIEWVNGLSDSDADLLEDLLQDTRDDQEFEGDVF